MTAIHPHVEPFGPLTLIGFVRRHSRIDEGYDITREIGRQWDAYMMQHAVLPWSPAAWRYGVMLRMADGDTEVNYFCGVPPPVPFAPRPGLVAMTIPALQWAVVPFDGHVNEFHDFVHAVFAVVLPRAGLQPAPDGPGIPEFVERYGQAFDLPARRGGFDMMVPVLA